MKCVLLCACLLLLSGCATVINQNPDLGDTAEYDFHKSFPDTGIEIAIFLPETIEASVYSRLGRSGLFVLNLKVINTGSDSYLLHREDIEVVTSSGFRYQSLSIDEALARTAGASRIYRLLPLPDIAKEYRLNGLKDLSLLSAGNKAPSELSKYLFFLINDEAADVSDARLTLPLRKIRLSNKVNHSVGIRRER